MASSCAFNDVLFIYINAQARTLRDDDHAFLVGEDRPIIDAIKEIVGFVVMNSEGLLLDKGVVRTSINLQVRCQCDWAQWAVQGKVTATS